MIREAAQMAETTGIVAVKLVVLFGVGVGLFHVALAVSRLVARLGPVGWSQHGILAVVLAVVVLLTVGGWWVAWTR